MTELLNSQLSR